MRTYRADKALASSWALATALDPLDVARLRPLMERSRGAREVVIGLVDGPVDFDHPDLAMPTSARVGKADCAVDSSAACQHGTLVTGILVARRESAAPAICPDCTVHIRPIFSEFSAAGLPRASIAELADALTDCLRAGVRVINVSAGLDGALAGAEGLRQVLDHALRRGVVVVAAAGNAATVGGSTLTRHPAVIPAVACDAQGRPLDESSLSFSTGRQGLLGPGDRVVSTAAGGGVGEISGSSAAAPFVTGTLALLWSLFPTASAAELRLAVAGNVGRRSGLVPRPLDAEATYWRLSGERRVR
jgi:subtilisin family serine protease